MGPRRELRAGPLEAVVGVAELAGRQGLPADVVLAVRRGQDDRDRAGGAEEDTSKGIEPPGIEVLDHLDDGRRVVADQAGVPVGERAVQEADPLPLCRRQPLQPQPLRGPIERSMRGVQPDDLGELRVGQEHRQQPSLAAAEVQNPPSAALLQDSQDGIEPLRRMCKWIVSERPLPGVKPIWEMAEGESALVA